MKTVEIEDAKSKIEKVILSCQTLDQFEVARRMIKSYSKNYNDENGVNILNDMLDGMGYETNSIIDWELHQKIMNKKRTVTLCVGIGLNQFFPEYITIELEPEYDEIIDISWLEKYSNPNK